MQGVAIAAALALLVLGVAGAYLFVDLATKAVTKHSTQIPRNTYHMEFIHGRNIQTVATAQGKWDIQLDVPSQGLAPYVIALSATGPRPGIPLPDGRLVPLAFDVVTAASLGGSIGTFFTGGVGTLDGNGEATAKLDLSTLPAAANGIPIWIGALVFDQAAPLGIGVIPDTTVMKIEGL